MSRYCYDCCKFVVYTEDTYGNTICPICKRIIEPAKNSVTAMVKSMEPIVTALRYKQDIARHSDRYFDEKDYMWVVGINIFKILRDNLSTYSAVSLDIDDFGDGVYLMGIRVMVDVCNPNRVSLFKEVK